MGHHPRQLPFRPRPIDQSPMDVHETARQREGVDVGKVHDLELVRVFRSRRVGGQLRAQPGDVLRDGRIGDHRELSFDLPRRLPADFDVLLYREHVEARLYRRLGLGHPGGEKHGQKRTSDRAVYFSRLPHCRRFVEQQAPDFRPIGNINRSAALEIRVLLIDSLFTVFCPGRRSRKLDPLRLALATARSDAACSP